MSRIATSYNRVAPTHYLLRVCDEQLRCDFPALAASLEGILGEDSKALLLPPCSFTLFAEAGHITCCLKPSVGRRKAFLTLGAGLSWQAALEEALTAGEIIWREDSPQKRG